MKKADMAVMVVELTEGIKTMQDQLGELREDLAGRMMPGEIIEVGNARVKLCEVEEKVLVGNAQILDLVGKKRFMEVAKVPCGALKAALEASVGDIYAARAIFNTCVKSFSKTTVLKVLKGGNKL